MSSPIKSNIAIIGGGLASLTLALSLHQRGIHCVIYEARPEDATTPGALMLSPNSLRILDNLGVYARIRDQGFDFQTVEFKNEKEETTDSYYLGSAAQYGYDCLRVYRQTLLLALRAAARAAGIPIHYSHKFSHITSEDAHTGTITFELAAGLGTRTASLLVGADGIHSKVRQHHIAPGTAATYGGRVAVTFATPRSWAQLPDDYPAPFSIHGAGGAFVMAPQTPDGKSELLAGTQIAFPEQDRAGWEALAADKEKLAGLLQADAGSKWSETPRKALEDIPLQTLGIWPFYFVPKLESWASAREEGAGRVVVLGDAAHAIPPTAGQGASQALEDAVTFAELVGGFEGAGREEWLKEVARWQRYRQQRVDKVIVLTLQLNNTRLPAEERAKLKDGEMWQSSGDGELAWLYSADIVRELREFEA
ncbi:FAD-dependent monooxygenase mdpD [Lasiodiplodia hormozganensis]|uniref:FAD-dependent monooxygenase mdpD n=1 Tax=Lasiodiplodia hormozganensis TaxID=869390 RepID=A0AA39XZG1_9PEZI|nr:FAD-dependent monooxygenase mdpD [Lasiodiplodia hormozganensis]